MYMRETERLIHFDRLRERLLVAGIAPRHVRRTLAELRDHYEDAVRDEQQRGKDAVSAEQAAWTRLGDEDDIAASIIARPELRSLPARYPRLVFGAGPVLLWIGATFVTLLALALIVITLQSANIVQAGSADPQWFRTFAEATCFVYARLLPPLIGLMMVAVAVRQRLITPALVIGAVIVAVVAGFTDITVSWPMADRAGELRISNWLPGLAMITDTAGAPTATQIRDGMTLAALNAAVMLLPYLLWRRRQGLT